jgi:hypothetical protein
LKAFLVTNMWQVYTRPTNASDFFLLLLNYNRYWCHFWFDWLFFDSIYFKNTYLREFRTTLTLSSHDIILFRIFFFSFTPELLQVSIIFLV